MPAESPLPAGTAPLSDSLAASPASRPVISSDYLRLMLTALGGGPEQAPDAGQQVQLLDAAMHLLSRLVDMAGRRRSGGNGGWAPERWRWQVGAGAVELAGGGRSGGDDGWAPERWR